ncbi:MAG: hypothetical protein M1827_007518 [Pycnora praestabilis]|nr:MAG: hypothetical protein M1827_007518 [Pycnora praestabilis]
MDYARCFIPRLGEHLYIHCPDSAGLRRTTIYAAAEYNILGRLMQYLPMHAPLNPRRVVYLFIYMGAAVESLTAAGATLMASATIGTSKNLSGGVLISVALVLQGVVECLFLSMVALLHHCCVRSHMLAPNVRMLCIMLYGTSSLVLLRCTFRAVQAFSMYTNSCGQYYCGTAINDEWYLYVFEAAPMALYTYWLNTIHPGRYLPVEHDRYLDPDGKTERMGPGWIDARSKAITFIDLFDMKSAFRGRPESTKFWLHLEQWPAYPETHVGPSAKPRGEEERS